MAGLFVFQVIKFYAYSPQLEFDYAPDEQELDVEEEVADQTPSSKDVDL
jgi:hypothetical protein